MNNEALKIFSADLARELKTKLQTQETAEFIDKVKASGDDRTFEVVMSTSDEDRQGDELDQAKWELKYYELNPVLLWAHNYSSFPIGIVTDITIKGKEAVASGKFAPKGVNPDADMACALYQEKILRAVSPGYIQNDDGTRELLEVSFCPVPAGRYALSMRQVRSLGLSTRELVTKGFFFETKGAVPYKDHGTADPDTAWDGPAEMKDCGDDLGKLKSICAWFDSDNADVKSAYKLPHHRASDLKAVWNGVKAAAAALQGGRGGVDIPSGDISAVKAHIASHYNEFDKTPPWEEKAEKGEEIGGHCELDDGTPGILAEDPENPGALVCVPPEGKSQEDNNDTNETMNQELVKNIKAETTRHGEAIAKSIDDFSEKAFDKDGNTQNDTDKSIDEFEKSIDGEHAEHLDRTMKAIDDGYELQDQKKSIDEFKAVMTGEHLEHVKSFDKAIDDFKSAWADGDDSDRKKAIDEFTTKSAAELGRHENAQRDLVKAEMGEAETDEEKAIADAVLKIGASISAKNKEKINAAIKALEEHHESFVADHQKSTNDVIASLKELMGSPQEDEGEEQKSETTPAPKPRSSPPVATESTDEKALSEFETYMLTRKLLKAVYQASGDGLAKIKKTLQEKYPDRR